jgi:hypothetical protein
MTDVESGCQSGMAPMRSGQAIHAMHRALKKKASPETGFFEEFLNFMKQNCLASWGHCPAIFPK